MMIKCARVFIKGRVQGVFFRQSASRKASSEGVSGWIKNLDDGRVEALFEGEEDKVAILLEWCNRGPIGASVDSIDVFWEKGIQGINKFSILG